MPREATGPPPPGLLFALRLLPPSPGQALHGEIEQVVSGERCRFGGSAELLAWLQDHVRAEGDRPLQGPDDRDATM